MTRATRRTFGLGMSAVALSLLGAARDEGHEMTTTPPEPEPTPEPPKPKKDDTARPYHDPNAKPYDEGH